MKQTTIFRLMVSLILLFVAIMGNGVTASASEEILIIEQDYKIIEQGKNGPTPKDIRQRMYLAKDWVRIDEYAGAGKMPSESYFINFKTKIIINVDHEHPTKVTETFKERRERIQKRKKKIKADQKNMVNGPQKDKSIKLYRGLLDDKRKFELLKGKDLKGKDPKKKTIMGEDCELVIVGDKKEKDFQPLKIYLHPKQNVPYDSAETLFLLQLIGSKLAAYLQKNQTTFKRLPMEMHLILAAGGRLDTKVVSIKKVKLSELDANIPTPPPYPEKVKRRPPPRKKKATKKATTVDPDD